MSIKTTVHLGRAASWCDRMQIAPAFLVAVVVLLLAAGISAIGRMRSNTPSAAHPTPSLPIILIATAKPAEPAPTAAPVVQVAAQLPRWVVCYDQPVNGSVLGPIPAPDTAAIVARYGTGWVMVPWDSGYCWLRAADVGLPDVADLQPSPPPAQPQVIYQVVNAPAEAVATPEAPPEPTPAYAVASQPAAAPVQWAPPPAVINPADFKEPDPKARCAFVGCLR